MYFHIDTSNGVSKNFQRHAYQLLEDASVTLVHYMGDNSIAVDFAHRNAVHSNASYARTCPSAMEKLKLLCKSDFANIVYKKETASLYSGSVKMQSQIPRNMKQLCNLRYQQLQQSRISKDDLFNLHEIAYDVSGYVWKIFTFPDLVCIFGLKEILDEFDKVLQLEHSSQLLSYDTTFQLGDFYVSTLLFRHIVFKEQPCIPAMFLIHERKLTETHRFMFQECLVRIPYLKKATCPIVTDNEKAIVNVIHDVLFNIPHVLCWNHLIHDVRYWLQKHAAPSADIATYIGDVRSLFHSPTEEMYNNKFSATQRTWDAQFEQYYIKEIHSNINSIGRWRLEELGIYNPYSGVTNNQSESMNRVIKDLQGWKEAPLDCIVLALHQLQAYYYNEIQRGFIGIGEYHIAKPYASLRVDASLPIEYIPACSPEEIVTFIKDKDYIKSTHFSDTVKCINEDEKEKKGFSSIYARAQLIVSNLAVTFDAKLHVFNVKGLSGEVRVVSLFPTEKCSCPALNICCHIIAAKLSIGINFTEKPSKRNLTLLRKKTRALCDKKSGRKKPRRKDVDCEYTSKYKVMREKKYNFCIQFTKHVQEAVL